MPTLMTVKVILCVHLRGYRLDWTDTDRSEKKELKSLGSFVCLSLRFLHDMHVEIIFV
jgi:hypothetical protein